jgi:hypothetical protein
LAQAQSNRGRRGRKRDFPDAERLVKRLVARELTLSFVPDAEQRLWRTVTRKKYQLRCDRVRLQNQVEALLEEAHIKLSSLVTDLLGVSARRMLKALADGETNPCHSHILPRSSALNWFTGQVLSGLPITLPAGKLCNSVQTRQVGSKYAASQIPSGKYTSTPPNLTPP